MRTSLLPILLFSLTSCDSANPEDRPDGAPGRDATSESPFGDAAPGEVVPDAAAAPTGACVVYTVRHLQASMQHTDATADLNTSIDKAFAAGADTISWTEIEAQAQIDHIEARAAWDTYWPKLPDAPLVRAANAVPISWRKDTWDFVSGSSVKASDGRAGVSPDRFVTRVVLRHKASGAEVMRIAHHAVAGIDSLDDNVAYRIAAHAADITAFNDRMMDSTLPVIGSGDFNTTSLRAKLKTENDGTQPYDYDVPAEGGSHGARLIDYVLRKKSDGAIHTLTETRFINLAPSDHRGVRATYEFRPAPCE